MTNSERRPFDTSLQGLAALYSRHFLSWLRGPQAVWLQELNSVIVAQQRRADFLIRYLDEEGQERLLHIEFQTVTQSGDPQIELPVRMVTYAAFALNRYGIVPDQVLVLLKDTAASQRVPNVFAQGRMRVEYDVVRLWEIDPTPLVESGLVGLMPLVPLMAGESLEELLEQAAEVIEAGVQSIQERNEVLTVTGLLASLKDARVVEQFMYTRSIMSLLTETPLFQMLTQETREQAQQ
jgi:predicted transposase YdaD